jgi:hypothetical protein
MKMRCWLFVAISLFALSHLACAEDMTVSNMVYKDCQVIRTQPDAIVIKHSTGIATLYFWELPSDLQKKYNYDPAMAQAYHQQAEEQRAVWQAKIKEQSKLEQQKIDQANALLAEQMTVYTNTPSGTPQYSATMKPSLNAGAPVVPAQEQLSFQQQLHTHGLGH